MMKWSDSFSVGVNEFDKQHKQLLDLINDFYEHIRSRSNEDNLAILIKEMKAYTRYHFKAEEDALRLWNYPHLDAQIEAHTEFVNKVEDLEQRFQEGKLKLSFEVTSFLRSWVVEHIQKEDKEYADFLKLKGK